MGRTFLLFATFVTLGAVTGCGSSDPNGGIPLDTSGNAKFHGTPLDAGVDAALDAGYVPFPSSGFSVAGSVADSVSNAALPGATVCLIGTPEACTTTDANGAFTVSGINTLDGFTIALKDYVTGVWPLTPKANLTSYTVLLRSAARLDDLATELGLTFSSANGAVDFEAFDGKGNALAGVAITISSQNGTTAYFDNGVLTTADKATTTAGTGIIFNVAPGTIAVGFASTGLTCTGANASGWPPGNGATVNIPIVAGEITRAAATCQ